MRAVKVHLLRRTFNRAKKEGKVPHSMENLYWKRLKKSYLAVAWIDLDEWEKVIGSNGTS